MRDRLLAIVRLLALLGLEAGAVVLLRGTGADSPEGMDWRRPGRWLQVTAPEDAVVAAVRLVGMAVATWLLLTTALYVLARLGRLGRLARGLEWATLPLVRKVVDGAVAASIAGGAVLGGAHPAGAQTTAPPPIVVDLTTTTTSPGHRYVPVAAGDAAPPVSTPPTTSLSAPASSTGVPTTTPLRPPPVPVAPVPTTPVDAPAPKAPPGWHLHTVVRGDNLWTIAEADVARQSGRSPEDLSVGAVASHWVKVVAANRERVASGNPNLIYAGETIVCPPVG